MLGATNNTVIELPGICATRGANDVVFSTAIPITCWELPWNESRKHVLSIGGDICQFFPLCRQQMIQKTNFFTSKLFNAAQIAILGLGLAALKIPCNIVQSPTRLTDFDRSFVVQPLTPSSQRAWFYQ